MPSNENKIEHFSLNLKSIKSIETEETDEGLLLKELPVFKAGQHRGIPFSTDHIDRNFIGQFDEKEDIPFQADHSHSFRDTLGFVKALKRKGDFLLADILLIDDNAIARWHKGLLKKFSAGIDMTKDKIREISAVAFPFIKEAAVLNDKDYVIYEGDEPSEREQLAIDNCQSKAATLTENIYIYEDGSTQSFPKKTEKTDEDLGLIISIEDDGSQTEVLGITEEDVVNLTKKDFVKTSDDMKDLPDSAFLLSKKPIKDKNRDRKFPFRDHSEHIVLSSINEALEKIDKTKDFSERTLSEGKKLLELLLKASTAKKRLFKEDDNRSKKMSLKDIDLNEFEGAEKELLKEAMETQASLEQDIATRNTELSEKTTEIESLKSDVKLKDVEAEVESLCNAGKVTPANKEATVTLLTSMSEEQIKSYISLMNETKPTIQLGEDNEEELQELNKDGAPKTYDVDAATPEEIDSFTEKVAKEHEVDFSDALDWVYDGLIDPNGKKIESA